MNLMKNLIFLMKQIIFVMYLMCIILGPQIRLIQENEMLKYVKIMEWKLIDMLFTPTVVRKLNNVNQKGYVKKKIK